MSWVTDRIAQLKKEGKYRTPRRAGGNARIPVRLRGKSEYSAPVYVYDLDDKLCDPEWASGPKFYDESFLRSLPLRKRRAVMDPPMCMEDTRNR